MISVLAVGPGGDAVRDEGPVVLDHLVVVGGEVNLGAGKGLVARSLAAI